MADLFFAGWRRTGALIAIIITLLVPVGMAINAWHDSSNFPVVKIKIMGYDPRDLLSGHYIMFQFDWNWSEGQPQDTACASGACCLCLGEGENNPPASLIACDAPKTPACVHRLKGNFYGGETFDIGYSQYFVPETRAIELEKLLREHPGKFDLGLSIKPSGKTVIEKLYYDGTFVEDYLRSTPPVPPSNE